jgi:hypothetical protein
MREEVDTQGRRCPQRWTLTPSFTRPQGLAHSSHLKNGGANRGSTHLMPVFNNMVCPQGWNFPLGGNIAPRGELCPLGRIFTPSFPPWVDTLYCLEEWRGEQRSSPPGDNFTPRGQCSPRGDNFAPGCEVKNGPSAPVLPDGFFSNHKSKFGQILKGLRWGNVDIFRAIWNILWIFGIFHDHLVHFCSFGTFFRF